MNASRFARWLSLVLCLSVVSGLGFAQQPSSEGQFEPQVGQPGKDVVWVPTPQALVDRMLELAKVTPADYVIDLGSGDGRTVISAAKLGVRALGIEYNPDMVELSKRNAASAGVADKARFIKADIFETDLSQATVITMFLLPDLNLRLRPRLLDLKPGTRIVSNSFTMGDWTADETASLINDCTAWCSALLWIVPAKVEGTWRLADAELKLTQSFQIVSGTLSSGDHTTPVRDGKLSGDEIRFNIENAHYSGRVRGNAIEGNVTSEGSNREWKALRSDTQAH